jgi:oxaloacetate decarboxylase alpha subunit
MLTNMESQLKEQGAADRMDEVLAEIPRVRHDLGYIPLVTPTSQIVGTQAVINVLTGERYKSITRETAGVLKGEYGATPAPVNAELQLRVLEGRQPVTCRPADLLEPELTALTGELRALAQEKSIALSPGEGEIDDVLTYALFPQIGLKFLQHRGDASAFEPVPATAAAPAVAAPPGVAAATSAGGQAALYTVKVNGQSYLVEVAEGGDVAAVSPLAGAVTTAPARAAHPLAAPLAGNIFHVNVIVGDEVQAGDVIVVLEAMKMETEVRAQRAGRVAEVMVKVGDKVAVGDPLISVA